MNESIDIKRLSHTDLIMYECGTEKCDAGHFYGPAVRDHFLIHYIHSGKGLFLVNGKTYHLGPGQGFLICPDIITYYQADLEDPWNYSWVGFQGVKAELYLQHAGLTADNPIFTSNQVPYIEKCFKDMKDTRQLKKSREIRLLGLLYLFLSQLIEDGDGDGYIDKSVNRKEQYVSRAVQFIEMNYSRHIGVTDISHHVGLDRSYLYSVFKQSLNTSPQEYLIQYRIGKACELMRNPALSLGDISRSVGYDDSLLFSKMFKKLKGKAPREYRKTVG